MHMIEALINSAQSYLLNLDEARLRYAFEYARDAHASQLRKDGSPYITHPVAAAEILTTLKVDEDTLIACLLHDVPEDTTRTISDIEKEFGSSVCFLVEGITKLSKVHYRNNMMTRQVESLKKLFLHSAQDPRIILIKLAEKTPVFVFCTLKLIQQLKCKFMLQKISVLISFNEVYKRLGRCSQPME